MSYKYGIRQLITKEFIQNRLKSFPAHVLGFADMIVSASLTGIVITSCEGCMDRFSAFAASQESVIGESMLNIGLRAPVLGLFEVHGYLNRLKVGF